MVLRFLPLLAAFAAVLVACGDDGGGGSGAVTDEEYKQACDNGVALCMSDPTHGQTFGAQDCSPSAIESAYASCDDGCRANSKPIIDCQKAATDCDGFVGCVQ